MKKQRRGPGFLRENYTESWLYIKESRNFIYITIAIFLLFVLFGFILPVSPEIEARILAFIEQLLAQTEGLTQGELIRFIFWNNLQSSFTGMLLGFFLGIFPVVSALTNGYLLGFVASRVADSNGVVVLWRLFPHGIFELPALFISLGLGLRLGTFIFEKKKLQTLGRYLIKSIKVFFFVVLPLLVIAAIIEGSLMSLLG